MKRLWHVVIPHTSWLLALAVLLACVLLVPAFRRPGYWALLTRDYFAAAALALALTPIILTGGIDLSVGSVAVFASVVVGFLWRDLGWPIGAAVAGGAVAGLVAGVGNGVLVAVGVLPLVATLATRELFRGLALTLAGTTPVSVFPPLLGSLWYANPWGIPSPVLVLAPLFLLTYLLVHHTWIGRMTFAVGDNERAARFAGVPVGRLKLGLYAFSGLVAGLCGTALIMQYDTAKPEAEAALELLAITCVVLGGVRVTGGAGHVAGTLLGVVTVAALQAGLTRVASAWRETVTGILLVVVAIVNEAAARWSARYSLTEEPEKQGK